MSNGRSTAGRAAGLIGAGLLGGVIGWTAHGLLSATPPEQTTALATPETTVRDTSAHATARADEAPGTLDDTARFWSALAFSMASRSHELESLIEELQNEGDDPRAAIERAIAASSDRDLASIVSAVTRIDEGDLLASGDVRPFASRLVDVALDGLDGPSAEAPADEPVLFAATTRDFDAGAARTTFPTDQERIFAVIELERLDAEQVMVKWLNTETRRIHSLQTMTHHPNRPLWSYLSRSGDWDPGRYEVSFYTQDAEMRLLGRGAFTVFDRSGRG